MCSLCQFLTTLVSKTSCQCEQLGPLGRKTGMLYLTVLALIPHSQLKRHSLTHTQVHVFYSNCRWKANQGTVAEYAFHNYPLLHMKNVFWMPLIKLVSQNSKHFDCIYNKGTNHIAKYANLTQGVILNGLTFMRIRFRHKW